MSQNPLMHLGSQFSKTPGLKPPLAAALASLEVQLDRELARYRRTRTGGYRASGQSSKDKNSSSIGLQYLTPVADTIPFDTAIPALDENISETPISETNVTPVTYINEITTTPPPPPPPPPLPSPKVAVTPDPIPDAIKETATPPLSTSASIVPVTTIKASTEENVESSTHQNEPDDYLESSEALLRSLTEEAPPPQKRPKSNSDSLLSPLGIGSILLFLMASIILGAVILNPKLLPQFSLDGLFKRDGSTATNNDTGSPSSDGNTKTVAQPQLTPITRYPNLAKDEFPEVKSPNDVVGLTPKPKPTPTVAPPPTPQNVAPPVVPAISAPTTQTPVAITPTPTPTDIPISEIKPSSDGFYHVVIDNTSEGAFANARKVVPDAYLSPDGKLIYLGAIKNKDKVQELLNDVRQKGLNARVK
ncbi:MAG: hypothetical protein KME29_00100 [Calothrix sp. FI2-JRJ7]|jgi:outer membrane biosynthesis protein TonB|nr:hypothetical protein [Calothrix sp. FI2-JRJ7]